MHSLIGLLFPWVQRQSLKHVLSQCSQTGFVTVDDFIPLYTCSYVFYSHGCNVRAWNLFWASVAKLVLLQLMILLPCTLTLTSYILMGAMYLYMQEHFSYSLIPLLFPWVLCIYMQECSVHSFIRLLFLWVQCIYTCKKVFYNRWYNLIPIAVTSFYRDNRSLAPC